MKIRIAQENDISNLVSIDRKAYGKYGADKKYFKQKLSSPNTRILSIDHPFIKNNVFGFWEKNGYENVGTIKWIAHPKELIDCYFYKKTTDSQIL